MSNYFEGNITEQFILNGYIKIENAFSKQLADTIVTRLWKDIPAECDNRESWAQPVIRLGMYSEPPFIEAANTAVLHDAFNHLLGEDYWQPCRSMGSFVIRFPSAVNPVDTGWHVDTSFPSDDPSDYMQWRSNLRSKGRGLLMLFLFSDVGEDDAPTRIRTGSHLDVARLLHPFGEKGLSTLEIAAELDYLPKRQEILATGSAGTVYLCHPFLVHAAQPHFGSEPRFLAQPPLFLKKELRLDKNAEETNAVEKAILLGLNIK